MRPQTRAPASRHFLTASRVAPAPSLSILAHRLATARVDLDVERQNFAGRVPQGPAPRRLLVCLEAYTTGLAARQLPIPPALRDELRLRRGL